MVGEGHWARTVEGCEGVASLSLVESCPVDYNLLLMPSLANLAHFFIDCPEGMPPLPFDPPPLFRLSHLSLSLYWHIDDTVPLLNKLLIASSASLTSLTLSDVGHSTPTLAAAVDIFSRTAFPSLRHLKIIRTRLSGFSRLLPLFQSITTLTLSDIDDYEGVFSDVARAAPPSLSVLSILRPRERTTPATFNDLRLSLSSPVFQNLRDLRLSRWFRRAIDDATWGEFEECEGRGLGLCISED